MTKECIVTPTKVELKLPNLKSTAIILFQHCTNDVKTIIVKIQEVHTSHLSWESIKSRLPRAPSRYSVVTVLLNGVS